MHDIERRRLIKTVAATAAMTTSGVSLAQAKTDGELYVIAEIVSRPDTADRLRELLVPFAASSAEEPGCLEYTLMEVESEPGRFLTYERWTGHPALEVHMQTSAIQALVPELEPVLAKPFTQIFLSAPRTA